MKDEIIQQLGIEGKIDAINNAGQTALDNIDTAKTNATQELETKQDELLEELGQQSVELRIEALEKENAEQQEELEALYNDFKPIPFEGVSNHIQDTGELPMPISINGGIVQDGEPSIENPVEVKGVRGHYDITVATDFIEPKSQNYPIDIPFEMYSGKAYKENGKWYRPIEFVKTEFNGEENIGLNSITDNYVEFVINNLIPQAPNSYISAKSNYFSNTTNNRVIVKKSQVLIRIPITDNITTLELFKTKLVELYANGTPLYVVYQLATPIKEEITDATLIAQLEALNKAYSYKEVTNINSYAESGADLVLSGNALMSNDIRIEALEKNIGTDLVIALDTINGEVI